jgi:hypothetical protein
MKRVFFLAALVSVMISQTGCFGSFELTKKVYNFHDELTDNKFVKSLIYWVIGGSVYGASVFIDGVVFNLIEFWTGSNPLAMNEGQTEEQFTKINGVDYKITATKNKMTFQKVDGDNLLDMGDMVFTEEASTWAFVKDGISNDLVTIDIKSNTAAYYTNNGIETIDLNNVDCVALNMNNSASYTFAMN